MAQVSTSNQVVDDRFIRDGYYEHKSVSFSIDLLYLFLLSCSMFVREVITVLLWSSCEGQTMGINYLVVVYTIIRKILPEKCTLVQKNQNRDHAWITDIVKTVP